MDERVKYGLIFYELTRNERFRVICCVEQKKYGLILYDINTDRITYMHPVTHKPVTITDYHDRKRVKDIATGCNYIEVREHD